MPVSSWKAANASISRFVSTPPKSLITARMRPSDSLKPRRPLVAAVPGRSLDRPPKKRERDSEAVGLHGGGRDRLAPTRGADTRRPACRARGRPCDVAASVVDGRDARILEGPGLRLAAGQARLDSSSPWLSPAGRAHRHDRQRLARSRPRRASGASASAQRSPPGVDTPARRQSSARRAPAARARRELAELLVAADPGRPCQRSAGGSAKSIGADVARASSSSFVVPRRIGRRQRSSGTAVSSRTPSASARSQLPGGRSRHRLGAPGQELAAGEQDRERAGGRAPGIRARRRSPKTSRSGSARLDQDGVLEAGAALWACSSLGADHPGGSSRSVLDVGAGLGRLGPARAGPGRTTTRAQPARRRAEHRAHERTPHDGTGRRQQQHEPERCP